MRLRLELFVQSVSASRDFYTRVLGFAEISYQPDGYSVFRLGDMQIALEAQAHLAPDHPLKPLAGERAGLGIEIVLEVADLEAAYARVQAAGWPLADPLVERPWGSRDFRLIDPNGFYIRVNDPT